MKDGLTNQLIDFIKCNNCIWIIWITHKARNVRQYVLKILQTAKKLIVVWTLQGSNVSLQKRKCNTWCCTIAASLWIDGFLLFLSLALRSYDHATQKWHAFFENYGLIFHETIYDFLPIVCRNLLLHNAKNCTCLLCCNSKILDHEYTTISIPVLCNLDDSYGFILKNGDIMFCANIKNCMLNILKKVWLKYVHRKSSYAWFNQGSK